MRDKTLKIFIIFTGLVGVSLLTLLMGQKYVTKYIDITTIRNEISQVAQNQNDIKNEIEQSVEVKKEAEVQEIEKIVRDVIRTEDLVNMKQLRDAINSIQFGAGSQDGMNKVAEEIARMASQILPKAQEIADTKKDIEAIQDSAEKIQEVSQNPDSFVSDQQKLEELSTAVVTLQKTVAESLEVKEMSVGTGGVTMAQVVSLLEAHKQELSQVNIAPQQSFVPDFEDTSKQIRETEEEFDEDLKRLRDQVYDRIDDGIDRAYQYIQSEVNNLTTFVETEVAKINEDFIALSGALNTQIADFNNIIENLNIIGEVKMVSIIPNPMPDGWQACDGTNGTFDLNAGNFVRGSQTPGTIQDDATAVNGLTISLDGEHTHTEQRAANINVNTRQQGGNAGRNQSNTTVNTGPGGEHTHAITGDTETRPMNISVFFICKI